MHSQFSSVVYELKKILGEGIHIEALQGGAINRSFCVEQSEKHYFLKLFDSATMQKLDRKVLFEQQQYLANKGLAAKPVYLSDNRDFQLDQWVDSINLLQSTLSRLEKCQLLAHTLSKIHRVEIPLATLDLEHDWHYYVSLCGRKLSTVEQQEMSLMLSYWRQESERLSVVCHNDLAFSHITEAPATVVFDWEYSALSTPYFDLASCITINQLSESEQNILMLSYANNMKLRLAEVRTKVKQMLPVVAKTNELWSRAFVG
ncbi:phosphotransferase [Paraglaciecola sp.]|uniref:phosphotransferase n=1 Tax=Paraglaciecola sp. TaxID=1920173 RepID=UPI0030F40640